MSRNAARLISILDKCKRVFTIDIGSNGDHFGTDKNGNENGSNITWDPSRDHIKDGSEPWHYRPPEIGLGHELVHAWIAATNVALVGKTWTEQLGYEEWGVTGATRRNGLPNGNFEFNENNFRRECGCASNRDAY
ncbi:type III secretion system effector protein [Massilia sp. B-10]|nr:type III secretion system effector protein [Massilia sp. B-10]